MTPPCAASPSATGSASPTPISRPSARSSRASSPPGEPSKSSTRPRRPTMPERAWSRPDPADNPFNAWYVTTSITGSGEGPLAGKTVAVKDNTAVAGVPMMNGAGTMEGYTPLRDATVVSRVLAAGATITGKAVCEDLCFSGGSHTSQTGPVRNPWDETRSAGGSSSRQRGARDGGHRGRGHRRRPGRLGAHPERLLRAPSGTSRPGAWCPTPARSRSRRRSTTSARSPARSPTPRSMLNVIAGPDGHDPRQPRDLVPDDYLAALDPRRLRPAGRRRHRGLRPPQLRGGRRRHRAGGHRDAARGGPRRRGRLDPVAQPRRPHLGRDRHRGRGQPDGRPQRLRAELEGPLRPGGHRALRQPVARRRHEVLRDGQVRAAHRGLGGRAAPRQALRDGAEPGLRAARRPTTRRCRATTCW